MVPRNIIIFGAPTIDRRFVLKLAGVPDANSPSPAKIFQTQRHSSVISKQQCTLYDTAGLNDSDVLSLEAREALGNLYRFTHALSGGINLLIYVVHDQPSPNNLKLFRDYLCRQDAPLILITTNLNHLSSKPDGVSHVLGLPLDGTDAESDKVLLQKSITRHLKKNPEVIQPMDRFERTAKESWKLLEKAARWTLAESRNALRDTFMEDAFFSEEYAKKKCGDIVEYIKKYYFCNVIVFGDTGAGKTSVIKMLTDECELDTIKASSAGGSTFMSRDYNIDIGEYHYVFHDTVGLNDGTSTSISPEEAIRELYQLIRKIEGGVSLLVYVHRGKIKPSQVTDYKLFSQVICENKVPTALVVTGLEQEDRGEWWDANKHLFDAQKIDTEYYACITSTKGKFDRKHKEFKYQDEYEESKEVLEKLFLNAPRLKPWEVRKTSGLWRSLVVEVYNIFAAKFKWGPLVANEALYKNLMAIGGMEENAAMGRVNNMERVLPWKVEGPRTDSTSTLATVG